jgi:hypothetical protein
MITIYITPDRLSGSFVRLVFRSQGKNMVKAVAAAVQLYYGSNASYSQLDVNYCSVETSGVVSEPLYYKSHGSISEQNANGSKGILEQLVTIEARRSEP